ncbi:MAG TPA: LEA type 2 family protein [Bacteroidales bacterium]|nr:LEA type 2 family protein [Bacteroidales bacterium]
MQNHKISRFLILLLCLSLAACKIQAPVIGNPTDYQVETLNLQEIKLKIWLPIENPNNIKFNVNDVDLDIFVNGLKLGKVTSMEKVHIPKKSSGTYAIKLDVKMKDLSVSAFSALRQLKSKYVNIKIDGDVTVSKFVIIKKVEVQVDEKVKIW